MSGQFSIPFPLPPPVGKCGQRLLSLLQIIEKNVEFRLFFLEYLLKALPKERIKLNTGTGSTLDFFRIWSREVRHLESKQAAASWDHNNLHLVFT